MSERRGAKPAKGRRGIAHIASARGDVSQLDPTVTSVRSGGAEPLDFYEDVMQGAEYTRPAVALLEGLPTGTPVVVRVYGHYETRGVRRRWRQERMVFADDALSTLLGVASDVIRAVRGNTSNKRELRGATNIVAQSITVTVVGQRPQLTKNVRKGKPVAETRSKLAPSRKRKKATKHKSTAPDTRKPKSVAKTSARKPSKREAQRIAEAQREARNARRRELAAARRKAEAAAARKAERARLARNARRRELAAEKRAAEAKRKRKGRRK